MPMRIHLNTHPRPSIVLSSSSLFAVDSFFRFRGSIFAHQNLGFCHFFSVFSFQSFLLLSLSAFLSVVVDTALHTSLLHTRQQLCSVTHKSCCCPKERPEDPSRISGFSFFARAAQEGKHCCSIYLFVSHCAVAFFYSDFFSICSPKSHRTRRAEFPAVAVPVSLLSVS